MRHPNGNGQIFDSSVSSDSFLSRDSVVQNESVVVQSGIENSIIDCSFVYDASIYNARILAVTIAGAGIRNSDISCDVVAGDGVRIDTSIVTGDSEVKDQAIVRESVVHDFLVYGKAVLQNVEILNGQLGRISKGVWTRAPRIFRFEELDCTLTESIDGLAHVGCQERSIDYWLSDRMRIWGLKNGWSDDQIKTLRTVLREWRQTPYQSC